MCTVHTFCSAVYSEYTAFGAENGDSCVLYTPFVLQCTVGTRPLGQNTEIHVFHVCQVYRPSLCLSNALGLAFQRFLEYGGFPNPLAKN